MPAGDKPTKPGMTPPGEMLGMTGMEKAVAQYAIFLIEDDPDDARQIEKTLRRSPYVYNIRTFPTGDELIARMVSEGYFGVGVSHDVPVLILLDLNLPGTDGIEILRELKEHPLTSDIPIIIITGDTSQKRAFEAYKLQADAYITKPVNLVQIHDVIYNGASGWMKERKPN
jgi:CheY-like chemotaxis protein